MTAAPGAVCSSQAGSLVRFKVRATYAGDGSAQPSGSVSLDFATAGSCTPGQDGPRSYEVTAGQLAHASVTGGATVLVFTNLTVTDDTARSNGGRKQVECVGWTLKVVVSGAGPRGATLGFTLVDGSGRVMWTSGTGDLVEGSVGN